MDLEVQGRIKEIAEKYGPENVVVILGNSDPDGASIFAETVTNGDPSFAGPLAGVALGLPVYHIIERLITFHEFISVASKGSMLTASSDSA